MSDARRRLAINALGVGAVLVGVVALLLLARPRSDVDLGLHLAVGRALVDNQLLRTPAGLPALTVLQDVAYVPSQWLAQVFGYLAWSSIGQSGVLILRLLALGVLIGALAWGCRAVTGLTAALMATVLAVFGSAIAWGERPQIAGLAAFAVTSALLWRSVRRPRLSILVLPVLWLWAMLHGTWIIGGGLIGAFAVGYVLSGQVRRGLMLAATSGLCVGAAVLNPLGVATITAPFTVSASARANVAEWSRPAFTNPFLLVVLAMAIITVVNWRRRRPCVLEVIVTVFSVALTLSMVRLIAFGAVALAPALAASVARLPSSAPAALPTTTERRIWVVVATCTALAAVAVTILSPPSLPIVGQTAARLDAFPAGTRVAVDQRLSGWVLWAHPHLDVMHDLRAEAYSRETSNAYRGFRLTHSGWEEYAAAHDIEVILTHEGTPLARALPTSEEWDLVSAGDENEIWVRRR